MKILFLMWLSIIVTVLFMAFKHEGTEGAIGFPFSDTVLSHKQYAHRLFDHISQAMLATIVGYFVVKVYGYRIPAIVFMCIWWSDVVDFCLTYGDAWTRSPVTFNTLKVITFGASIVGLWAYNLIKRHVGSPEGN